MKFRKLLWIIAYSMGGAVCITQSSSVDEAYILQSPIEHDLDGFEDMLAFEENPSRALFADYDAICDRQPIKIAPWYMRWLTSAGSSVFVRYVAAKKIVARWYRIFIHKGRA